MDIVKKYSKAIAGFLAGIVGNILIDISNGRVPFPTTSAEWIRYLVSAVVAAGGVALAPANTVTQKQVDKSPNVVASVVVPEMAVEASHAARDAVVAATKDLGPAAQDAVADVTSQVSSAVDEVIRGFGAGKHRPKP